MNFESCCRTCTSKTSLNPVFKEKDEEEKYSTVIQLISGISIRETDLLPKLLCTACINFINKVFEFRKKCLEANSILSQKLAEGCNFEEFEESEILRNNIDINKNKSVSFVKEELSDEIDQDTLPLACLLPKEEKKRIKVKKKKEKIVTNGVNGFKKGCDRNTRSSSKKAGRTITKGYVECDKCHKTVKANGFNLHYKKHTGFDIVCEHCGKSFAARRKLLAHCKAKHGYEKTDKCSYCDYAASNLEQLKIHERIHTGEKPYVCKVCGAGFHRNSNYIQHLPIHLPEKTVQCDQCPAMFKSVTLMRIHKHTRHKVSKYEYRCSVCKTTFARRYNVAKHLRRIHSVTAIVAHVERIKIV